MNVRRFIPALNWINAYDRSWFKGDLSAGLTVGVMLVPQGMAYAMLAGLPPIYGLYASIIPLLMYAFLGTSRQLAVGPVAMVALLVAAGVAPLAKGDASLYISYAIILAFMVGLLQFLMGLFRAGFLVNFLSHPVISGFTSAAAIIIGFSQLKHLLGIPIPRSNFIHEILGSAFELGSDINLFTLAIGIIAIAILLLIKRFKWRVPGPLVVVVLGVLVVYVFQLNKAGVSIVGAVPNGFPAFSTPTLSKAILLELLPVALAISFIGFMESIAVAKAIQAKHKDYEIDANQELMGLGLANIAGSFFQAFPTTGGFSRTAVNDQAGAKTGLASIISALLVTITLLFLTPLFYFMPNAILASIIMVAVIGLVNIKEAIYLWGAHRTDFFMLVAAFSGTLILGIEEGIIIGVALSLGTIIYQTTKPHLAILGKIPDKPYYRNVDRFDTLETRSDILIVRFDARLYFANVQFFTDTIRSLLEERADALKLFILDADSINDIDSTGMHALEEIQQYCKDQGIAFAMVAVKGPIRDRLKKAGALQHIGEQNFYFRIQDAIDAFDGIPSNSFKQYVMQTN